MISRELERRFESRDVNLLEAVVIQAGLPEQKIRWAEDCPRKFSRVIISFAEMVDELCPTELHAHWLSPFIEQIANCRPTHSWQDWDNEHLRYFHIHARLRVLMTAYTAKPPREPFHWPDGAIWYTPQFIRLCEWADKEERETKRIFWNHVLSILSEAIRIPHDRQLQENSEASLRPEIYGLENL